MDRVCLVGLGVGQASVTLNRTRRSSLIEATRVRHEAKGAHRGATQSQVHGGDKDIVQADYGEQVVLGVHRGDDGREGMVAHEGVHSNAQQAQHSARGADKCVRGVLRVLGREAKSPPSSCRVPCAVDGIVDCLRYHLGHDGGLRAGRGEPAR